MEDSYNYKAEVAKNRLDVDIRLKEPEIDPAKRFIIMKNQESLSLENQNP